MPVSVEGLCYWKQKSHFPNVPSMLDDFYSYCESSIFPKQLTGLGFKSPAFCLVHHTTQATVLVDEFAAEWNKLGHARAIALVFHGTPESNVDHIILRNGLDPSKRKAQAYGAGEYFSKEPGLSVSYCKGGHRMLVFAVVLPSRKFCKQGCPEDYVIVNVNRHQMPIGFITFERVDQGVLAVSCERRKKIRELSQKVYEKQKEADEHVLKAKIIQQIIGGYFDIGSELYRKKKDLLSHVSKQEIAMYVQHHVEKAVIEYFFPNLPAPMTVQEWNEAIVKRVEEVEEEAMQAQTDMDRESMKTIMRGREDQGNNK